MRNGRRAGLAVAACLMVTAGAVTAVGPAAAGPLPPVEVPNNKGSLDWGDNHAGQLGDGTLARRTTPVQPVGLANGVIHVAAGGDHTLAVRSSGVVMAWGANEQGQLGDGTRDLRAVPIQVPGLTGVTQVAAGDAHSLALRSDGTVMAWGDNSRGQLGDGSLTDRLAPVRVAGLTGVVQIAAGGTFSLARRSDGSVRAWGSNDAGQLGDGTLVDRPRPVAVLGLPEVVQVAAGSRHSLALRFDGLAFAWGDNSGAALGDGTSVNRSVPVPVSVLRAVTHVAAGAGFTVAVSGGQPFWWGVDCHEVGPDIAVCGSSSTPEVRAVNLTGITRVAAGESHRLAVGADGSVWSWGSNFFGQLGDGTTTFRPDPVRVLAVGGAQHIDAGADHTVVLVARPPVVGP
jgi:alpha-tubulin suppressor-like RCC1 family protein